MKNLLRENGQSLDEIVFQNRNKNYGAYALRREEGSMLGKAMFFGISIFVVLGITPLIIAGMDTTVANTPEGSGPLWVPVPEVVVPEKVIPAAAKPVETSVQTYNTSVVVPKRDAVESPAAEINRTQAVPGLQDTPGNPPVTQYSPPAVVPGNSVVPAQTAPPVADPNAIPVRVDVMADFQGGIQAFRKKVIQNFNGDAYVGSGEKISAVVTFVVEKDGTISAVKASGKDPEFNREAEKAVVSAKGKWKPAVLDGQKVRSHFRIPITMQFE